jgi:hypothetical protein
MHHYLQDRDWAQDAVLRPQNGNFSLKDANFESSLFPTLKRPKNMSAVFTGWIRSADCSYERSANLLMPQNAIFWLR